jgi:hypothetical protein
MTEADEVAASLVKALLFPSVASLGRRISLDECRAVVRCAMPDETEVVTDNVAWAAWQRVNDLVLHERISCGCCRGDPGDRCVCHIHQDWNERAQTCDYHKRLADTGARS